MFALRNNIATWPGLGDNKGYKMCRVQIGVRGMSRYSTDGWGKKRSRESICPGSMSLRPCVCEPDLAECLAACCPRGARTMRGDSHDIAERRRGIMARALAV